MSAFKMLFAAVVLLFSLVGVWSEYESLRINREFKDHKNFKLLNFGDTCGTTRLIVKPRILGKKSEEADLGQYPWMARLKYKISAPEVEDSQEIRCAGVIISDQYILTAAHCDPKEIEKSQRKRFQTRGLNLTWNSAILGEHDERTPKDCDRSRYCLPPPQDVAISSYKCHKLYNRNTMENDICIIRLAEKIHFTDSVRPICLPFYNEILKNNLTGNELEVAGWGTYKYNKNENGEMKRETSPVLLRITVPFLDREKCNRMVVDGGYPAISRGQICTGVAKEKTPCHGDSGGPLMKRYSINGDARSFLFGIVSWGIPDFYKFGTPVCKVDGSPEMYANVRYYLKWILDNLPTN